MNLQTQLALSVIRDNAHLTNAVRTYNLSADGLKYLFIEVGIGRSVDIPNTVVLLVDWDKVHYCILTDEVNNGTS